MERKQPKTCVWVSAVGRERNLQRSQTVNAEKNTQIGYNPDKHTQGQQHGSLARSKIH